MPRIQHFRISNTWHCRYGAHSALVPKQCGMRLYEYANSLKWCPPFLFQQRFTRRLTFCKWKRKYETKNCWIDVIQIPQILLNRIWLIGYFFIMFVIFGGNWTQNKCVLILLAQKTFRTEKKVKSHRVQSKASKIIGRKCSRQRRIWTSMCAHRCRDYATMKWVGPFVFS